jgi:hypothetical protein
MHRIDGPGATVDNKFTEGNPGTGTPATNVTADWATAIQEEIANVIEQTGVALNKAVNTQLYTAIQALIAAGGGGGGGGATTALEVSIADSGSYYAGENVEAALQEVGVSLKSLAEAPINSIVALAAASQTELAHANALLEITSATAVNYTVRTDASANLPIKTVIHIAQGGAGKINIVAAGGVTVKKGASFNAATMEQNAMVALVKVAANTWRLGGALEAV